MALRREIVDFVLLHCLHDPDQATPISHIAVVQDELPPTYVQILVQIIDPIGVKERGAAIDAVDFVAFLQEELGELGAVLTCKTGKLICSSSRLVPIVDVFEPDDVVLAEIAAGLHFDDFKCDSARVFQSVFCANGNIG